MIIHKIKKFLLSFEGGLGRKNFALTILPCLLLLILFGSLSMWFLEANPLMLNFFEWFFVLAFLPLFLLIIWFWFITYIPFVVVIGIFNEAGWGAVLDWAGRFMLILVLPIGLLSYLFCLLTVKRLNDLKLGGQWILLSLVPFVNWLFLAYLLLKDSSKDKI